MMHSLTRTLVALAAGAAITGVAQAAVAQDDFLVNPPKHTCVKPGYPGHLAKEVTINKWRKDVEGYGECIKRYASAQQKNAEAFVKAGNAAVDEYNAAVKQFQEESKH